MIYRVMVDDVGDGRVLIGRPLVELWPALPILLVEDGKPSAGVQTYRNERRGVSLTLDATIRVRLLDGSTELAVLWPRWRFGVEIMIGLLWVVALLHASNGMTSWVGVLLLVMLARLASAVAFGYGLIARRPWPGVAFAALAMGVGVALAQPLIGGDVGAWRVGLLVLGVPSLTLAAVVGRAVADMLDRGYEYIGMALGSLASLSLLAVAFSLAWR